MIAITPQDNNQVIANQVIVSANPEFKQLTTTVFSNGYLKPDFQDQHSAELENLLKEWMIKGIKYNLHQQEADTMNGVVDKMIFVLEIQE